MHKQNIKGKVQIASYDDLLSGGVDHSKSDITDMPLINLYEFKNHPFHVVDDEKMDELVQSIKEKGVLSPAIVRKREKGGYEIISGHRRRRACELAGLLSMPVIIKDLDDNDATILMVDANIQRENILPSERAYSLKMKMNALKNQGKRNDLTSGQSDPKLTAEKIGDKEGISASVVKRYVRLTNLIPDILQRVDAGKIGFMQAVDLSYIPEKEQKIIMGVIEDNDKKMTARQAKMLRNAYECGTLDREEVTSILIGKNAIIRTVTLSESELKNFFPEDMDAGDIKEIITGLLEKWKEESTDG
ncbi:MAG: ParB/RepB/Spo0J family partition protein [Lachnospiraceae bacterium]|nr:ParB/RepB/Spo0J family partition protein [Lachnospiraceae bacterium]